jgi:epoxide hydrolase-like predicted phosphatase
MPMSSRLSGPPAPIRAVIFDWGGVIEPLPNAARFAEWERRLGLPPGALQPVLWGDLWQEVERGAVTLDAYGAYVCRACGFAGPEELEAFAQEFYPRRADPRMLAALRALRPRYRTAILSNAFHGQREHIAALTGAPVEALVDDYINSAEVGLRKPEIEIFRLALDRLGVAPPEAVFLDDTAANIAGAAAAGLRGILVEEPEQALAALRALLGHPLDG